MHTSIDDLGGTNLLIYLEIYKKYIENYFNTYSGREVIQEYSSGRNNLFIHVISMANFLRVSAISFAASITL